MLFTGNLPFVIGINLEKIVTNALMSSDKALHWVPSS
ncbi:hypothetical protein Pat9b_2339 [Pantoea sp. At-9b]|nr:hypothetical protein Pat9b_2339 [Pantoea sp. At-9b]